MFVADVKCPQATWQTIPNSRADSESRCAYVAPRTCYQRKTEGIVGCLRRRDGCNHPRPHTTHDHWETRDWIATSVRQSASLPTCRQQSGLNASAAARLIFHLQRITSTIALC